MSELLAAALPRYAVAPTCRPRVTGEEVDAFEQLVLREENTDLAAVPAIAAAVSPTALWQQLCSGARYLWTQMLAGDGYQWFVETGRFDP
ncbi:hypothetical protein MJ575_14180 [Klebsiella pneumoniae]|nr:hypothetical protein MJ575_14180 [Klebsiella pneumoniae]